MASEQKTTGTVLLVEDDPGFRDAISGFLKKAGYEVLAVENGIIAFQLLEERLKRLGDAQVGVLVSDWVMPEMDGIQLLSKVRGSSHKTIPFVLMSGAVTQDQLLHAVQLGADAVLLKPFKPDTLGSKIREAIEGREKKEMNKLGLKAR